MVTVNSVYFGQLFNLPEFCSATCFGGWENKSFHSYQPTVNIYAIPF